MASNKGAPLAGLAILKHTYDLSDEALCDRWTENPYFQPSCGKRVLLPQAALRSLVDVTETAICRILSQLGCIVTN